MNATDSAEPSPGPAAAQPLVSRLGALDLLLVSIWCGLTAGVLEVLIVILRKQFVDWNKLYWMPRQFVWLVPVADLAIFSVLGVALALLSRLGRVGRSVAIRLLCGLFFVPMVWAAFPLIYGPASFVLAVGLGVQAGAFVERRAAAVRRFTLLTCAIPALVLLGFAGWTFGGDRLLAWKEAGRPLPSPGSPNVVLVVLDTVAAEHLALYGYDRPTSPTLETLADRGILFRRAVAPSSWTLPSHASFFTGRWPYELSAGWLTPLDRQAPSLAEYLSRHGYATAGFVANTWYCSADSGLGRGFTVYRDYLLDDLGAFKYAVLIDRPLEGARQLDNELRRRFGIDLLRPFVRTVWWRFNASSRKDAAHVNAELLGWLSNRPDPHRPFFAFLNYYDAHYPYELPAGAIHRHGLRPRNDREVDLIQNWRTVDKRNLMPGEIGFVRNSYDDCVTALDEQLGRLVDALERRDLLGNTWLVVLSDHGESFGEHKGDFGHGTSLYQTQLHVPLLVVPPTPQRTRMRIDVEVSLRDLPATIVDLLGFQDPRAFPGESLVPLWAQAGAGRPVETSPAISVVVPTDPVEPDPLKLMESREVWASLTQDGWSYILGEGTSGEQLYHLKDDPGERLDHARDPAAADRLASMRAALNRATGGPLKLEQFKP